VVRSEEGEWAWDGEGERSGGGARSEGGGDREPQLLSSARRDRIGPGGLARTLAPLICLQIQTRSVSADRSPGPSLNVFYAGIYFALSRRAAVTYGTVLVVELMSHELMSPKTRTLAPLNFSAMD